MPVKKRIGETTLQTTTTSLKQLILAAPVVFVDCCRETDTDMIHVGPFQGLLYVGF